MKRQVRLGVFETNSSMTHALTMCTDSEYRRWQNDEVYWQRWGNNFVAIEEIKEEFKLDSYYNDFDEYRRDAGLMTYDEFGDYDYMPFETFNKTLVKKNNLLELGGRDNHETEWLQNSN